MSVLQEFKIHSLGRRAFLLFFVRKIRPVIFFAILDTGLWYLAPTLPEEYSFWGTYAAQIGLLVAIAFLVLALAFAWVEYRGHTYSFTDEAFVWTSGWAVRKEMAALYHQIQNVNINRSPMNRVFGASEVVIYMTGADPELGHAKILLPAISRKRAKMIQKALLIRARRHTAQGEYREEYAGEDVLR